MKAMPTLLIESMCTNLLFACIARECAILAVCADDFAMAKHFGQLAGSFSGVATDLDKAARLMI